MDNLVSQAKRVNQGAYKIIENQWANAIKKGQKVAVDIKIKYNEGGIRPVSFEVSYKIDNVSYYQIVNN